MWGVPVASHAGARHEQTRYADYLPKRGASWLPELVVYPVVGALAGLVVALLLARLGFRLTRRTSGANA